MIEILRVLYDSILKNKRGERDRFILSKGHGCLGLYISYDKGFIKKYLGIWNK